jgi:hypothetical protein
MGELRLRSVLAASVLLAASVVLAAPASAGCEGQAFAQYCDGPIRPDGTWDRCFVAYGSTNAFGAVTVPAVGRCYPIDPNAWPMLPLGQPQYHVYP